MLARSQVPEEAGLKPPNPLEPVPNPYCWYGPISQEARSPVEILNSSSRHSKPPAMLRSEAMPTSTG